MKKLIKKLLYLIVNLGCNYTWKEITNNLGLLKKKNIRYLLYERLIPKMRFELFWKKIIEQLKSEDLKSIESIFNIIDDESKFILSKLLYFAGLYGDETTKMVLQFAKETTNIDYRYWTTQDISRFTFLLQSGFYPEYYNDRRELLKQVAIDMRLTIPKKRQEESDKLCIVTHLLADSEKNSVQRCVDMISKGLLPCFSEIQVFPLDVFSPGKKELNELTTVLPYKPSIYEKKDIQQLLPDGVKVHYPEGENYKEKAQDVLNSIYAFNPCVILDMSDEYSAISYHYSKDFFTLYLPLRDTNSSLFFNAIVGAPKWKFHESNLKFNSVDIKMVKEWNFPEYVPSRIKHHNRESLEIAKDAFVIISIGNNSTTFTKEFIDEMCSLVADHNFIWLLVGQDAPEYMKNTYKNLYEKHLIIEHGYEQNLYSICTLCNVHVRPNMTGGSGATAIAAMAGLPIAMTNYLCDPSRWLGVDFHSDISTYRDLKNYIVELSVNKDFYNSEKNKVLSLINDAIDTPEKWKALAQILKGEDEHDK